MAGIDVPFEIRVIDGIDESYPDTLPTKDIAEYISKKKAAAYRETMAVDELVITADTIVVLGSQVMGKPHDADEACYMLRQLSGQTHQVISLSGYPAGSIQTQSVLFDRCGFFCVRKYGMIRNDGRVGRLRLANDHLTNRSRQYGGTGKQK